MPRPTQQKADIERLKKLDTATRQSISNKAIIALTMRYCQATYKEIADVFGISRQAAEDIVKKAEKGI